MLGILVPAGVTDAIGIDESAYHVISVTAGGLAGAAATIGILILAARRVAVGRVRTATPRSDLVMYPLLLVTLLTGMAATFGDNLLFGEYHYRETVSPWFRGVLTFDPDPDLMAGALPLPGARRLRLAALRGLALHPPRARLEHPAHIPGSELDRLRSRSPHPAVARPRRR